MACLVSQAASRRSSPPSQFPEEIEFPEVSVDVAKGSVQIPRVTEDSEVLVGVATESTRPEHIVGMRVNHTQLPVVVVGPGDAEDSGTL